METKICKKCGIEKIIDEFRINKGYHLNKCRKCEYEYQKQYRKALFNVVSEERKN